MTTNNAQVTRSTLLLFEYDCEIYQPENSMHHVNALSINMLYLVLANTNYIARLQSDHKH